MINTARCIRNLGCTKKKGEEFKVKPTYSFADMIPDELKGMTCSANTAG